MSAQQVPVCLTRVATKEGGWHINKEEKCKLKEKKSDKLAFLLKPMKNKLADEEKKIQEKQRLLNRTPEVKLAEDAARTAAKAAKNLK